MDENPEDAISLNMMAIFSYIVDNKTDAMYYLEEAIETNPNDELAYLNRAEMYSFDKNYKEAIRNVTTAINLVPDDPDNYITRAQYYYSDEDYQKALDDISTCLSKATEGDGFKNDPLLYEFRAYVYIGLHNYSAARNDVQKAYRLSKDKDLDRRLEALYAIL
ncbi:MAG: tetratricopeptide repeat protein [Paludibacteraceae bacterium]|nr:tetratricopeptide repeat protein [Paludibacteraceae bacterium]